MLGQMMFKLLNWRYVLTRMTENMDINTPGCMLFWFWLTWTKKKKRIYVFYWITKLCFFFHIRNSNSNLVNENFSIDKWMNKSMIDSLSYIKKIKSYIQEQLIVLWSISIDRSHSNTYLTSDVHLTTCNIHVFIK